MIIDDNHMVKLQLTWPSSPHDLLGGVNYSASRQKCINYKITVIDRRGRSRVACTRASAMISLRETRPGRSIGIAYPKTILTRVAQTVNGETQRIIIMIRKAIHRAVGNRFWPHGFFVFLFIRFEYGAFT